MVNKMVIAMLDLLFCDQSEDNISSVQKTETKESENVFWNCCATLHEALNGHNPPSKGDNYLLSNEIIKLLNKCNFIIWQNDN